MRGISLIAAATIASELGDLTRLETPGKLMAFLGLVKVKSLFVIILPRLCTIHSLQARYEFIRHCRRQIC